MCVEATWTLCGQSKDSSLRPRPKPSLGFVNVSAQAKNTCELVVTNR